MTKNLLQGWQWQCGKAGMISTRLDTLTHVLFIQCTRAVGTMSDTTRPSHRPLGFASKVSTSLKIETTSFTHPTLLLL